jgi:hypothetical protein
MYDIQKREAIRPNTTLLELCVDKDVVANEGAVGEGIEILPMT